MTAMQVWVSEIKMRAFNAVKNITSILNYIGLVWYMCLWEYIHVPQFKGIGKTIFDNLAFYLANTFWKHEKHALRMQDVLKDKSSQKFRQFFLGLN